MNKIDFLVELIGIGNFTGSLLHILIGIIFLKKNRESNISRSFASFFIFLALAMFLGGFYYLLPLNLTGMQIIYSLIYAVSMVGIFSLVFGVRLLVFPTNNPLKSPIVPTLVIITVMTLILSITGVTHIQETKNPLYTPWFMLSFTATYDIPLLYIIYQLSKKRDWISAERKKWFDNLKYFFIIESFYPIIESLSGVSNETRLLDLINGIFVFTSLLLLKWLPNYKDWYMDELKTLTVIKQIQKNYSGSIDDLWDKMTIWQEEFVQANKQLTSSDFNGYLQDIEDSLDFKIK